MSTVSVVIPAYNRAKVLERAISSAIAQTYNDLEIIVVDDGSSDNTPEIISEIKDRRVRYIRYENNRGPGYARNAGLKAAKGQYIAFLDSDDEWLPLKIQKQVNLMSSLPEDWGICYTSAKIIKDGVNASVRRADKAMQGDVLKAYIRGKVALATPTIMIRRGCITRVGLFDERLMRSQDSELFLRILKFYKLAACPEVLAVIHLETTKKSFGEVVESSRLKILEKHERDIGARLGYLAARHFRANAFWIIADSKFRGGDFVGGTRYFIRAVVSYPFMPVGGYIRIALAAGNLLDATKRLRTRKSAPPE